MKNIIYSFLLILFFTTCNWENGISSLDPVNWEKRKITISNLDSMIVGKTYLPVYSQIYQLHENKTYDLTVTVSLRNISSYDSIFILNADFHNPKGELIRNYFNEPIYLKPLETVAIVIDENDKEGGTGGNFVFDWAVQNEKNLPLFEAVMISTTGQQGLSFLTRGVRVFD